MNYRQFFNRLVRYGHRFSIEKSLALQQRGEVRTDGLVLTCVSHRLEVEWYAREIHPWDRGCSPCEADRLFSEQCFADTDAAVSRLFTELPEIDVIQFRVLKSGSRDELLTGTVVRPAPDVSDRHASPRSRLWRMGVRVSMLALAAAVYVSVAAP